MEAIQTEFPITKAIVCRGISIQSNPGGVTEEVIVNG
jgi:hypothetical protein